MAEQNDQDSYASDEERRRRAIEQRSTTDQYHTVDSTAKQPGHGVADQGTQGANDDQGNKQA